MIHKRTNIEILKKLDFNIIYNTDVEIILSNNIVTIAINKTPMWYRNNCKYSLYYAPNKVINLDRIENVIQRIKSTT